MQMAIHWDWDWHIVTLMETTCSHSATKAIAPCTIEKQKNAMGQMPSLTTTIIKPMVYSKLVISGEQEI